MEISYSDANRVAQECEHIEGMACKVRGKYRECDRPLCCGFCPSVDDCEEVCLKILRRLVEELE